MRTKYNNINDTYNETPKRTTRGLLFECDYNKIDTSIECLEILDHENNEADEFNSNSLSPSRSQFLKQKYCIDHSTKFS